MEKDVYIKLLSLQQEDHSEPSKCELFTEGKYKKIPGGFEVSYDESEATGFEGSKTKVTCLGNNYVSMQRYGTTNSNLIVEADKKHHCQYGTPYGDFVIGITTKKIENKLSETGGRLFLSYTVDINGFYLSNNEINLTVVEHKM